MSKQSEREKIVAEAIGRAETDYTYSLVGEGDDKLSENCPDYRIHSARAAIAAYEATLEVTPEAKRVAELENGIKDLMLYCNSDAGANIRRIQARLIEILGRLETGVTRHWAVAELFCSYRKNIESMNKIVYEVRHGSNNAERIAALMNQHNELEIAQLKAQITKHEEAHQGNKRIIESRCDEIFELQHEIELLKNQLLESERRYRIRDDSSKFWAKKLDEEHAKVVELSAQRSDLRAAFCAGGFRK